MLGAWTAIPESLNATIPIAMPGGWCWTKSVAIALAASIRVGGWSVAAMLPDTSNARTTVPCPTGSATVPCGRAIATTIPVRASTNSAAGIADRARAPGPLAIRPGSASAPARRARRRPMERYASAPSGMSTSRSSANGHAKDIGYLRRRRRAAIRTMARTRSSSVDSGSASTPARRKAVAIPSSRRLAAASNRSRKARSPVST